MARSQDSEKVLVVRLDRNFNVIDYNSRYQSPTAFKSTTIHRVPESRRKRPAVYEDKTPTSYRQMNYVQDTASDIVLPYEGRSQEVLMQAPSKRRRRRLRYIPPKSTVQIFDEKVDWHAQSKIDTHNDEGMKQIRSHRRPVIVDEPRVWFAPSRTDNHNPDYVRRRRQERSLQYQQSYNMSQDLRSSNHEFYYTNYVPVYDEFNRQYQPVGIPPMQNRRSVWPERSRRPSGVSEKRDRWNFIKPKIDSHNEHMIDYIESQPKSKIINNLPRWRSEPRIRTFNESYDPRYTHIKPVIFDEKPRWYARSKIDTGFASDPY
ncbi:unnamed protein product [Adineta ricciae]|uniref:Uncharacterized protein n=1 Tax=Adineta ricciae TaxID=249248 RepID=A0A814BM12_ADIRI|nr:unnamed protein product [Adineta ricciae]